MENDFPTPEVVEGKKEIEKKELTSNGPESEDTTNKLEETSNKGSNEEESKMVLYSYHCCQFFPCFKDFP